jgi:hypothetical protein
VRAPSFEVTRHYRAHPSREADVEAQRVALLRLLRLRVAEECMTSEERPCCLMPTDRERSGHLQQASGDVMCVCQPDSEACELGEKHRNREDLP